MASTDSPLICYGLQVIISGPWEPWKTGCSAAEAEAAYEANVANYDPVFMYG